jgi:hypothetical protein
MQRLEDDLQQREGALKSLQDLHLSTKEGLEARVADLEAQTKRLTQRNRSLEAHRVQEADGWAADVCQLRR